MIRAISETDPRIAPSPNDPMRVARAFVDECYTDDKLNILLRHHRNTFYRYDGRCWPEAEDRKLRADLYGWLEDAIYKKKTKDTEELVPFEPTAFKIANIIDALRAVGHVGQDVTPPAWLIEMDPPAEEILSMENGLLHLPTRTLMPHSPRFFSQFALPYAYDPDAPEPERWHRFLRELWDDDDESIDALGEIIGYILGGDTRQQKIFGLVGPKRSGKGTIARVITGLIGVHNIAAPTLASMVTNFGLQELIGKPLGVVADARLSTRADSTIAVERLLSISGEDSLTIDRKYRDPWTGRLPTRFLILTNELPRLIDSSGALASRFHLLTLTRTFYGREDPTLTDTLLAEAAGIFNWALEGLDRLTHRGYFELPASSREAVRQMEDLSSPVGAFVRDHCEVGPENEVIKDDLFAAWKRWCEDEGKSRPGSKSVFIRDLRAAVPGMSVRRPREGSVRYHVVQGLRLKPEEQSNEPLTTADHANHADTEEVGQGSWSGVRAMQNRRSDEVVRGGQGSSPLLPTVGNFADPCVRCDRYGVGHEGEHLEAWEALAGGLA